MMKKQRKHVHEVVINDEVIIKKRKKRKIVKEHPKWKVFLIVLISFLSLLLLLAIAFFAFHEFGKSNMRTEYSEGKYIEYDGNMYEYNKNVVSVLVMGHDQKSNDEYEGVSGQCDFILLVTFDTESGKLKGISIPRDIMVEIGEYFGGLAQAQGDNGFIQVCLAYGYGDGKEKSCNNMIQAVSRLFKNIPIKYYFALNLDGISALNDAIGGVTLIPIESIPNTSIEKNIKTTLLGKNAKTYVQYRNKSDIHSSEQRRTREVQYVQEFYKQAFSGNTGISRAINLFGIANQYSNSNLGISEFSYLAGLALSKNINSLEISSLEGDLKMGKKYVEIWPDQKKLEKLIIDTYYTEIDSNNNDN